jgi:hypothetical protein
MIPDTQDAALAQYQAEVDAWVAAGPPAPLTAAEASRNIGCVVLLVAFVGLLKGWWA